MPRFLYKAVNADGEIIEGEFDAADRQAVIDRLHAQGHTPIRADPRAESGGRRRALPRLFQARRVTRRDLMLLTQELATLLGAGLPLDRGGLVDEEALLHALNNKLIGGAGIDVLSEEPPVNGNVLLDAELPNLIVTPHIAWATREARQRAIDEMAENIRAFLGGGRRNWVN